jgi:hypothetical protein
MIDWERRWRKFENGDEPICICEEAARQMGIVRYVNHNFQPQPSHLNCWWSFALVAVFPQCGHFIGQI